ncbi:MAG: D-alanyl-D-alanine carboxypeptidase, partial [Clostridia bacterium]|nr:D-alanyl-D-alanine carboxypeptidase [Clostridia bacterium]
MKKMIAAIFAAAITIFASIPAFAVSTSAMSAILIEAESGNVLYEKDADARRGPASTTKIMTAIIAIERCPLDKVVEVAPEAAGVEGSSVYLYAGEKITMES